MQEAGDLSAKPSKSWQSNAQRNVWRSFKRLGIGWKVPLSMWEYVSEEGVVLQLPYISPKSYVEYFVNHVPDVLVGGVMSDQDRAIHLKSFWAAYRQSHGTHEVFDPNSEQDLSHTLPLCLHGDEGRGKRRTGTMVISLESPLGLVSRKRKRDCCSVARRHVEKLTRDVVPLGSALDAVDMMAHNTKGHSFLQRWPLVIIPGVVYKVYPSMVHQFHDMIAREMRSLFYEGVKGPAGRIYTGALVGLKGDLDWHDKVGQFIRSWRHLGKKNQLFCCHQCLGGDAKLPWEDVGEYPCWEPTTFGVRPWMEGPQVPPPPLTQIPFDKDASEMMFRTDPFHTGKLGPMRDVAGSTVFWLLEPGYFGTVGDVAVKLQRAHQMFQMYCGAQATAPALRSFTKALFQYKSRQTFPWSNTKGSDTTLLLQWLQAQVEGCVQDPISADDVPTAVLIQRTIGALLRFYDSMYKHGLFLPRSCAIAMYLDGCRFISGYCILAQSSVGHQKLWAVKPKLHMCRHLLVEMRQALEAGSERVLSPLAWNCEQNEDSIGRLSRLSRRLDSRGMSARVLMCFLVKGQILHKRFHSESPAKPRAHRGR